MTLADKIRSRVEIEANGCWTWQGAKTRKGYGVIHNPATGRNVYTHRAMYEHRHGRIPEGQQIDHLCREPRCCNPGHLEAVTPATNTQRGLAPVVTRLRHRSLMQCPHGHAYTEENTYIAPSGGRSCKACRRRRNEEWNAKRRAGYRDFTAEGGNVTSIARAKNA